MKWYKRREEVKERYTATYAGSEGKLHSNIWLWVYTQTIILRAKWQDTGYGWGSLKTWLQLAFYFISLSCRNQKKPKMKVFAFALLLLVAVTYGKYWIIGRILLKVLVAVHWLNQPCIYSCIYIIFLVGQWMVSKPWTWALDFDMDIFELFQIFGLWQSNINGL